MELTVQPPRKKTLTSRLLKPEIDKFISNRNHILSQEVVSTLGQVSPCGFVQVLQGGMKSTDKETLEVNVNEVDLSIRQNGGFSVFFWLITSKSKNTKNCNILKKGNTVDQFTPTIGLSNSQSNLFVTLSTSKSKKETIYANKSIDKSHFYSVAVTFLIHYDEEFTEVSIYLDGKLDTQTTIPGEPLHNQGNVYIGKPDTTSRGFVGTIADVVIVPGVIMDDQVKTIHECGLESLAYSKGTSINTEKAFKEVFDRVKLIKKYALYTGKPIYAIANLNLSNEKMREVVKNYDEEERKNDIRPPPEKRNLKEESMLHNLEMFLSNEDNEIRVIAYYLPQFHPVPENDKYWGKGFTEWTNVASAKPLFRGHYQPRIPSDLGFYDLRIPQVREEQARIWDKYRCNRPCGYTLLFQKESRLHLLCACEDSSVLDKFFFLFPCLMISYYVGKSINVPNSHLFQDGNTMLHISLCIERWYQRYSNCNTCFIINQTLKIFDDLPVVSPCICLVYFGIHVFDVHYPVVNNSLQHLHKYQRHIERGFNVNFPFLLLSFLLLSSFSFSSYLLYLHQYL